jgi:hypothetical protein
MGQLVRNFVDLDRAKRRFVEVTLTGSLSMLALFSDATRGDPAFEEDEDAYIRQMGFRKHGDRLYVALGCTAKEAGIRGMYRKARTVDFDESRHVRETLPGMDGDDAVDATLKVGIVLARTEIGAIAAGGSAALLRGDDVPGAGKYRDQRTRALAEAIPLMQGWLDDPGSRPGASPGMPAP